LKKKESNRRKEIFVYNKGKKPNEGATFKHCKKCTSHLGSSKFIYSTKKEGQEEVANRQNHKVYKCPYGYGWHSTTDVNYERRKFLIQDFNNLKVSLFKEDLVIELNLDKKNYLMKSFLENKSIDSLHFYTLWSFTKETTNKINLDRHRLLCNYLNENNLNKIYEFEFIKNSTESGFGYAAVNSNTNQLKNFFKQQGIDYYFYLAPGGILRFSPSMYKRKKYSK
tara:strand:+ start:295 stop:966 length:672 start_codon:yes stop_codon:yes gene_type:complete